MPGVIGTVLAVPQVELELAEATLRAAARLLGGRLCAPEAGGDAELTPAQHERIRLTVWQLQNAFEAGTAIPRAEWQRAFAALSVVTSDLQTTLIGAVEIVDRIVHEAEREFGTASGRGRYKRNQAKAALLYAFREADVELPGVSPILEPFVFDAAADVMIDFVVCHLNAMDGWEAGLPAQPVGLRQRLVTPVADSAGESLGRLGLWLTALAWRLMLWRRAPSPGIRAVIDDHGLALSHLLGAVRVLAGFMQRHRSFVRMLVGVLATATNEAEQFVGLSGPRKQRYARELILTFLDQNGLIPPTVLGRRVAEVVIDVLIDMTVALYNHRQVFRHKAAQTPGPGVPADAASQ